MISAEVMLLLKHAVENEFNTVVALFDKDGNPISDSSGEPEPGTCMPPKDDRLIPVADRDEVYGYLHCKTEMNVQKTEAIRLFVRAVVNLGDKGLMIDKAARAETMLVSRMLGEDAHIYYNDIVAYGADLGYQIEHPVALIVASLEANYHDCLNISFGYESATNDAKHRVLRLIKEHQYMNKQDIVAFTQDNYLVIMKAVSDLGDMTALYQAIDKLSAMLSDILNSYRIFRYYIAPGEIVENFADAHGVYQDAQRNIGYAKKMDLDHPIIRQDDVLYNHLISKLPGRVRLETIDAKVKLLLSQNHEMVSGLMECFEAFINNGFNITNTAYEAYLHRNTVKKRLEKLYRLTGFDPMGDFEDVLMNKLILYQYLIDSREQEL